MSKVVELFGQSAAKPGVDWKTVVTGQQCVFANKKCYKIRKSDPDTAIGSCTVLYGREPEPVIICPTRLIERRQIFTDCFHLLTTCQAPCDHVPRRSYPLFLARDVLRTLREAVKRTRPATRKTRATTDRRPANHESESA